MRPQRIFAQRGGVMRSYLDLAVRGLRSRTKRKQDGGHDRGAPSNCLHHRTYEVRCGKVKSAGGG